MAAENGGHLKKDGPMPKDPTTGPRPMHHRHKLGETDGQHAPFGADEPSTAKRIGNDERKVY